MPPAAIPTGQFTGAKAYVEKWSLPPPASWIGDGTEKPAGDLLPSAVGRAPALPKASDEMDDAQLLAAITGKQ